MPNPEKPKYIIDLEQIYKFVQTNKEISGFTNEAKLSFKDKSDTGFSFDRTAVDTMLWGKLLSKGYTLKQLLNPKDDNEAAQFKQAMDAERQEFVNLMAGVVPGDQESQDRLRKYAAEAYINVIKASETYLNEEILSKDLKYGDLSIKGKKDFLFTIYLCHDASQEIDRIKPVVGETYKQMVGGDREVNQYFQELSDTSANISDMMLAFDPILDDKKGLPSLYEIPFDRSEAEQAEFDRETLVNGILPNLIVKHIIEEEISKNHTEGIAKINISKVYTNNYMPASMAAMGLDKETKDRICEILLDQQKKNVFLPGIMLAEKDDLFTIDPKTGNFDLQPFKTFVNRVYENPELFVVVDENTTIGDKLFELNDRTTGRETIVTDDQISTGVTGNIREAVLKNNPHAYDKLFEIGDAGTKEAPATIHLNGNPAEDRSGEDVTISFNVAGSSFAQPLRYDLGLAGKSNILASKDGKLGKYKKGEADEEYIFENNGEQIVLKGDKVKQFVSNRLDQVYGKPALFTKYDGKTTKTLKLKDIRVKKNQHNGYDYSISGPRVDVFGKKDSGLFNAGDYSIDKTRQNIRDIGRGHLNTLLGNQKFMNGKGKINFDFTGHSRGGVGAVQGAMMLKHLVETEYPQLKDRVSFSVLLYDPVPGPKNRVKSNVNHAINLREQTKEMDEQGMAAFGEKDKTVVVYSIGCNHTHGFDPMKVMGADTVIMTGQTHDEGLKDVEMQFNKKTRQAYINAENCEAYHTDGLRSMPKGIFVADENKVMVRMKDTNDAEDVVRDVLPNQNDRTRRILEVCSDIDVRGGGEPSLEVIARGFEAHDPFYIISSKEFRDMRKNFGKLVDIMNSDKRDFEEIVSLRDTLRKNAVDYVTSKLGKEPHSNRTQGRLAVAKNIIRVLDLDRDRTLNWNIKTHLEKSPDDIHVQREFLKSSKQTYEQNKNFLAEVSRQYLQGTPVESELFRDTVISMMTDRYFIKQSEKYFDAKNLEFTDKLETLLGDGNLSLFQTFSQSKTIKELTDRITTDELANIFASEKTAEQMLDSLTNSVLKEKLKEVHKDNIKQDIKLEEKASEKQVALDHEFDWVVL